MNEAELLAELQILRAELVLDVQLATTREHHIRSTSHVQQIDRMLLRLSDNPPPTVCPQPVSVD